MDADPAGRRTPGRGQALAAAALVLVTLLAGAGRWFVAERTLPARPIGDENYYLGTAGQIALGHGHRFLDDRYRALLPPLQSYALVPFVDTDRVRGEAGAAFLLELQHLRRRDARPEHAAFLRPLVLSQVVVGTLIVLATGVLGWQLFEPRVGVVAALLCALDPTFVVYSHSLFADPLFTLLLLVGLIGVVRLEHGGPVALFAVVGVVFGLAALAREVGIVVAGAGGMWLLLRAEPTRRLSTLLRVATLGLVMLATIAPWTWRNHQVFDRFVPISSRGWGTVRDGTTMSKENWLRFDRVALERWNERYFAIPDEMRRMDESRREALALIRMDQPWWLPKKVVRTFVHLFKPDSDLLWKLGLGAYGPVPMGTRRALLVGHTAFYLAVLAAGILGVCAARERGRRELAVWVLGSVIAIHVLVSAIMRYRLPMMPLFMVYAAFLLVDPRRLRDLDRAGLLGAALCLAVLFGLCVPYFWEGWWAVWTRGTYGELPP